MLSVCPPERPILLLLYWGHSREDHHGVLSSQRRVPQALVASGWCFLGQGPQLPLSSVPAPSVVSSCSLGTVSLPLLRNFIFEFLPPPS